MKFIHKLFALYLLSTATTAMTAMNPSLRTPDNLRRSTSHNNTSKSVRFNDVRIFNTAEIETKYTTDIAHMIDAYFNNKDIKDNKKKNACEHLIEKYIKQGAEQYTNQEINIAIAMYKAEQDSNNQHRTAVMTVANNEIRSQRQRALIRSNKSNFYDHATTHLFRASLIVGGLYLASSYFQNTKKK